MTPVGELHHVTPRLAVWQAYSPLAKVDCTSSALGLEEGWFLIDPIPLEQLCVDELTSSRPLAGIVLTSGNHQRASLEFQVRYGLPIYAPKAPDLVADVWIEEGDDILEGAEIIAMPGAAPGEIALSSGEIVIFGDAVIHLGELMLLPDKYCEDSKALPVSLRRINERPCTIACFAHGLPLIQDARAKLEALVI